MADLDKLVDELSKLTVIEAAELAKKLEETWGVSAAAPVAVAAAAPAEGGAAAEVQTEFDVILAADGEKKINVIKEVRAITGLGLKEAKELVEGRTQAVREAVGKEEATQKQKNQEEAGRNLGRLCGGPGCRGCRGSGRGWRGCRGADRVRRHPGRGRGEEDQRHQGGPCHHRSRPQGGEGSGRRRAEGGQGSRRQGRGRADQEEAGRSRRDGRAQVA